VCLGLNAKDLQWCKNLKRVVAESVSTSVVVCSVTSRQSIETLKRKQAR